MARLTIVSLKDVRKALFDARNSWYDIGVELDVSPPTLDNIKTQSDSNADCLREMLKVWLKGLDCSWKVIVAALRSKALMENTGALATKIEKEYCTDVAVEQDALITTGSIKEGIVAELQGEVKKLKSEVSALKTQQKLDQGGFSSVTELASNSGINISAEAKFIITSDKAHIFELKHLGLRVNFPEDALPPGVTETTVHVQTSLSGQYCIPDGFELASAVYWFSAPVKFSRPVTVEIQHNAAFDDPSAKLCFTICKCPMSVELRLPYTFEKLEGGGFTSRNGSIAVPGFSGLGIIMPKGGPQHYLSQLWYAKKSERDWSVYYVITKDLVAFKSAVEACYSDEACQGNCVRVDLEGNQIMLDIPMEGIRTEEWTITPLYSPVILKEDANSFSSARLPVCELAVHWEDTSASDMPAKFTLNVNLLGAKAPGSVVLNFTTGAPQHYLSQLWYVKKSEKTWSVYYVITRDLVALKSAVEAYYSNDAHQGRCERIDFEGSEIMLDIPKKGIRTDGWKITPVYQQVIKKEDCNTFSSGRLPVCELAVRRGGTEMPERFTFAINLVGAKAPGSVVLDITQSAFKAHVFKLFYNILDDYNCDVHWTNRLDIDMEEKYIKQLGCLVGPEMEVFFQSEIISLEIPAAVSGWRIISEVPKLQVSRGRSSSVHFRVKRDANMQEPLIMGVLLKGARPPNNVIRIFLDPSVWGAQKSLAISFQQQRIRAEERREEARREEARRMEARREEETRRGVMYEEIDEMFTEKIRREIHRESGLRSLYMPTMTDPLSPLSLHDIVREKRSIKSPSVTTVPSPSGKQSTSNLRSKKWYQLGIRLDIDHAALDAIGKASTDDEEKLISVLYKWTNPKI